MHAILGTFCKFSMFSTLPGLVVVEAYLVKTNTNRNTFPTAKHAEVRSLPAARRAAASAWLGMVTCAVSIAMPIMI